MNPELGVMVLNDENKLEPWEFRFSCITKAQDTFRQRWKTDTNPQIVQMIHLGKPIDHYYYRSNEWIDQPFADPRKFLQPYRGPAEYANPGLYGEGKFIEDREYTATFVELFLEETNDK